MTVEVKALKDINLKAVNVQQLPDGFKNSVPQYEEFEVGHVLSRLLSTEADSPTGRLKMAACSMFMFDGAQPRLAHERGEGRHGMSFAIDLKKGQTYRFAVVGSTMSSAQHPDAINEVKRLAIYCKMQGVERLMVQHRSLWHGLWKSDIVIEGDKQSQQDVHNMMYHLYAFVREGSRLSISPMGLSGLGYNGHVFWDADTWMFPALLLLHPELARSMVDYRSDRLEAAKQYAFEHGYKGAMYVWESADSGFEDTPVFAMTGPFEHHVTGCVALAAWQYYCVARDAEWLRLSGYPILKETADYWLSRVEKGRDGMYHINNVVAADEWAENVDNNAFTNGAAKVNLLCAARAARELGLEPNQRWTEVADSIAFIKGEGGVTMEYLGYKGQPIKQADVNLLAYPLKLATDRKSIGADLEYYRTKVPEKETPAMTQAIFALLYSRLGNERMAWHYFKDSYMPNRLPPFGVIAETKGGTNPYFATGAGGTLQAVIMGFGGIDISYEGRGISQMKSLLPKKWKKLTFTSIGKEHRCYTVSNP